MLTQEQLDTIDNPGNPTAVPPLQLRSAGPASVSLIKRLPLIGPITDAIISPTTGAVVGVAAGNLTLITP